MKKKHLFGLVHLVLFFFLGTFVFSRQTVEKISLTKAIEEGLNTNYEYLNTILDEQSAALQRQISSKDKLFRIDFDASYLYKSETMIIGIPAVEIPGIYTVPGREIEAGLHHSYDLNIGLTQPLFTGGILSNSIKLNEVRQAIEANQKILKVNEFAGLIKSSYFQFHLLTQKKQSLQILEKNMELHRQRIEDLRSEGLVRKSDLLETLSKIEEIQANISDIEQAIESERIHFYKLCGHYPEEIEAAYKEEPINRNAALSYFEENHPVLKTLQNQADILTLQKKINSGKYLPQVSGFAELHYGKPGIDFFKKKWALYFQGGIVLSLQVFEWNRLRGEKILLDYQEQKLLNEKNKFIQDVAASLEILFISLQKLEEKKAHITQLLEYSKEDADLKEALYVERQIPNVDYLEALLTQEKNALLLQEIQIQIERIKVNINTLIGKSKEDAHE
jgi:outer membrane protein TolC